MSFVGVLNDKMCGFYNSTYTQAGEKKEMATTQFEATDARRSFPCWDEPALKATFTFTLTVPEAMTAVSNMPVTSTTPCEKLPGWKTVAFDKSCIMSTYLGAFVIGDMNFIEGAFLFTFSLFFCEAFCSHFRPRSQGPGLLVAAQ